DRYGVPSIVHDDAGGAQAAVRYLHEQGRTPIAFLGRVKTSAVGRERFNGYRRGLEAIGGEFCKEWVFAFGEGDRAEAGYHAISRALSDGHRFTAVLAASDELALGGIAAAADAGLSVPEDVAFVGFGGLEWVQYTRPALTTVR